MTTSVDSPGRLVGSMLGSAASRPALRLLRDRRGSAVSPVAARAGWAESRSLVVEDAICLHMIPHVPLGACIEAHLLQQAEALDVIGARMAAIDPASRQAVLARYPRTGFAQQLSEAMRQQAERAAQTRTRLLWRMRFERAIRRSAWRE